MKKLFVSLSGSIFLLAANVSAVEFSNQPQQGGKSVYSNIPAECVRDGVLVCLDYHPLNQLHFKKAGPVGKTPASPEAQREPDIRINRLPSSAPISPAQATPTSSQPQLQVLQQLVEMNRILDEHFPAQGSAGDQARVQRQQGQLMQILGELENAAEDDARSTIRQAIELFQSGMAK